MMGSSKLDFLIRKNKGKKVYNKYKQLFLDAGFVEKDIKYVDLETSDKIIANIKQIFPPIEEKTEMLIDSEDTVSSKLLSIAFSGSDNLAECYMFSDDYDICGMYLAKSNFVEKFCLNVAKYGYSNTCFIVDENFKFSMTINYDSIINSESIGSFDIHLKENKRTIET
ncbi:hypothetical protein [Pedobacter terrae]|uniref:hypothetical protein n=1 Tax=Pedobacter terrae TaxID=405671 RepID=UPI002FF74F89